MESYNHVWEHMKKIILDKENEEIHKMVWHNHAVITDQDSIRYRIDANTWSVDQLRVFLKELRRSGRPSDSTLYRHVMIRSIVALISIFSLN